jgi:O-antigen ligase/Flp pilus assembly protein TadD
MSSRDHGNEEDLEMNGLIFSIVVFLLIFAPLAFGTVEPWSFAMMEFLSFLAFLLFLISKRRNGELFLYDIPGLLPLVLFLVYILLQIVPLPSDVLKIVSPVTHKIYTETIWAADPNSWESLSVNKRATLLEFFRFASYAAFYILTIQLLSKRELLKKTVGIVVVFISALAFVSTVQHFLWNDKIYWLRAVPVGAHPFGPYVNRNHYAGLVGMVLPLVVCLFIIYRPRYYCRSLRERIVEVFSNPLTNIHILLGFSALLLGTSVFLSLSRGGIISLCISMIFLAVMIGKKGKGKKVRILTAMIPMLVIYCVGWFGWDNVFKRFENLRDAGGVISEWRPGIWKDSLKMAVDFPLTGIGLGSYISLYPKYRSISADEIVDHAHNDYLELFSEGGLIAGVLVVWFLWGVLRKSSRMFIRRQEPYSAFLYIGSVTGIVSILIHSVTDFNMHIGANGLYLFFLAGLAVSAANMRMERGPNDTSLEKKVPITNRVLIPAVAALLVSTFFNAGGLLASNALSSLRGVRSDAHMSKEEVQAMRNVAQRTSFLDPLNAKPRLVLAKAEWQLSNRKNAVDEYIAALHRDPVNGYVLQTLGLAMSRLSRDDKAEEFLQSGIRFDGSNPVRYKTYASWLISSGRLEDAAGYIRRAISLEPEKTRDYIALLVLSGLTDEEIQRALPDMIKPHILFAEYLSQTGMESMAAAEYHSAFDHIGNEKKMEPSSFYHAYRYFMKKGLLDDALMVMRKAEEYFPKDVGVKMTIAEMFEKAGMHSRAEEEYRKVLVIEPENSIAKKKLEEFK